MDGYIYLWRSRAATKACYSLFESVKKCIVLRYIFSKVAPVKSSYNIEHYLTLALVVAQQWMILIQQTNVLAFPDEVHILE